MTPKHHPDLPPHASPSLPFPSLASLVSVLCLVLLLRHSQVAMDYMRQGLTLCAETLIPSLFPFLVLSELLVISGVGEALGQLCSGVMRRVFGVSGAGASAVILGSACGFPVGARTAVGLLDRGGITKKECEHLLTLVNQPSSAYLISTVGVGLYGCRRIGVILYLVVVFCGLLTGLIAGLLLGRPGKNLSPPSSPSARHPRGPEALTAALASSTSGMMTVCAYVVFFSVITGLIGQIMEGRGSYGRVCHLLLGGVLEMTGGIGLASALPKPSSLILTAVFAGWSGLSVHGQIMALCGGRGLSFRPYLLAKTFQGLLCGVITWGLLRLHPALLAPENQPVIRLMHGFASARELPSWVALFADGCFILGWLFTIIVGRKARRTTGNPYPSGKCS